MVAVCFCLLCLGIIFYYHIRERKLLARLQQMLDCAIFGTFEDRQLDESKLSLLETSMQRYLCDQKLSYTELFEQKENMQKLISDISHQAATPVANIMLYSQLLEEDLASIPDSSHLVQYISPILDQAGKMDFFIQLLTKIARLEKDIIALKPVEQRIDSVLHALEQQYGLKAKEKNIRLTVASSSETAVFDRKWTIEAASNVVDNAIKYTPAGGNISVCVTPYQMFLRLDVTDNGIGIHESEHGKIFTRFYRCGTVQDEMGTGIGLYITREVMKAQDGYVKVSSKEGTGSTFSLFFLKHQLSQK